MKKKIRFCFLFILFFTGCMFISCKNSTDKLQTSFYTKVADKLPVKVLINGDSIGEGLSNANFASMMESSFGSNTQIDNISLPGNTSFAGFCQANIQYTPDTTYDLIILCYGQNDLDSDNFSLEYENLIRTTIEKYPEAQIVSILESSQKTHTNKIKKIIGLCEYYHIPYADTIHSFSHSGYSYEELTADAIHPNALGYKLYCQTIIDLLQSGLSESPFGRAESKEPLNPQCDLFDNAVYISKEDMTQTDDGYIYQTDQSINGIGMDRTFLPGEHTLKIQIEDQLLDVSYTWNYTFSQRHIEPLTDTPYHGVTIRITSPNTEDDNFFHGIILLSAS